MIFNPDFREFIESLNKHNVRYLLIGGYASREKIEIEGLKVNLIDLNNLKLKKKATGRHQDLADLENLT